MRDAGPVPPVRRPLALLLAVAAVIASLGPTAEASAEVVGCDRAAEQVVVSGAVELDPACTYTGGLVVTDSHTTLDCRGASIVGGATGFGVLIYAPTTVALTDVHVVDCRIEGFFNGIKISRPGFLELAEGVEYVNAFTDLSIERTSVSGAAAVGVYVDGYVTGVTIRDSELVGNASTGIYLDTGTRWNVIEGNRIEGNGFVESGAGGSTSEVGGILFRSWGPGREGLALDGSRDNVIRANRFARNSAGSIFLYKNCGENYLSAAESWLPRRYGSNANRIEGNEFEGERYGVWVGSRMGENTWPMECSAPAYAEGGIERYVLDEATDNVVRANAFDDVTYGVLVEDDRTTVEDNDFTGPSPERHAVIVGTTKRTRVLGRPVRGTVVRDNRSTISGNASPYRWSVGEADSTVEGNVALGRPVGWCEAPEVPHLVMIMTIAFAVQPPDEPPVPAPDLTVPVLGALPACAAEGTTTSTTTVATTTSTPGASPGAAAPAATPIRGTAGYTG